MAPKQTGAVAAQHAEAQKTAMLELMRALFALRYRNVVEDVTPLLANYVQHFLFGEEDDVRLRLNKMTTVTSTSASNQLAACGELPVLLRGALCLSADPNPMLELMNNGISLLIKLDGARTCAVLGAGRKSSSHWAAEAIKSQTATKTAVDALVGADAAVPEQLSLAVPPLPSASRSTLASGVVLFGNFFKRCFSGPSVDAWRAELGSNHPGPVPRVELLDDQHDQLGKNVWMEIFIRTEAKNPKKKVAASVQMTHDGRYVVQGKLYPHARPVDTTPLDTVKAALEPIHSHLETAAEFMKGDMKAAIAAVKANGVLNTLIGAFADDFVRTARPAGHKLSDKDVKDKVVKVLAAGPGTVESVPGQSEHDRNKAFTRDLIVEALSWLVTESDWSRTMGNEEAILRFEESFINYELQEGTGAEPGSSAAEASQVGYMALEQAYHALIDAGLAASGPGSVKDADKSSAWADPTRPFPQQYFGRLAGPKGQLSATAAYVTKAVKSSFPKGHADGWKASYDLSSSLFSKLPSLSKGDTAAFTEAELSSASVTDKYCLLRGLAGAEDVLNTMKDAVKAWRASQDAAQGAEGTDIATAGSSTTGAQPQLQVYPFAAAVELLVAGPGVPLMGKLSDTVDHARIVRTKPKHGNKHALIRRDFIDSGCMLKAIMAAEGILTALAVSSGAKWLLQLRDLVHKAETEHGLSFGAIAPSWAEWASQAEARLPTQMSELDARRHVDAWARACIENMGKARASLLEEVETADAITSTDLKNRIMNAGFLVYLKRREKLPAQPANIAGLTKLLQDADILPRAPEDLVDVEATQAIGASQASAGAAASSSAATGAAAKKGKRRGRAASNSSAGGGEAGEGKGQGASQASQGEDVVELLDDEEEDGALARVPGAARSKKGKAGAGPEAPAAATGFTRANRAWLVRKLPKRGYKSPLLQEKLGPLEEDEEAWEQDLDYLSLGIPSDVTKKEHVLREMYHAHARDQAFRAAVVEELGFNDSAEFELWESHRFATDGVPAVASSQAAGASYKDSQLIGRPKAAKEAEAAAKAAAAAGASGAPGTGAPGAGVSATGAYVAPSASGWGKLKGLQADSEQPDMDVVTDPEELTRMGYSTEDHAWAAAGGNKTAFEQYMAVRKALEAEEAKKTAAAKSAQIAAAIARGDAAAKARAAAAAAAGGAGAGASSGPAQAGAVAASSSYAGSSHIVYKQAAPRAGRNTVWTTESTAAFVDAFNKWNDSKTANIWKKIEDDPQFAGLLPPQNYANMYKDKHKAMFKKGDIGPRNTAGCGAGAYGGNKAGLGSGFGGAGGAAGAGFGFDDDDMDAGQQQFFGEDYDGAGAAGGTGASVSASSGAGASVGYGYGSASGSAAGLSAGHAFKSGSAKPASSKAAALGADDFDQYSDGFAGLPTDYGADATEGQEGMDVDHGGAGAGAGTAHGTVNGSQGPVAYRGRVWSVEATNAFIACFNKHNSSGYVYDLWKRIEQDKEFQGQFPPPTNPSAYKDKHKALLVRGLVADRGASSADAKSGPGSRGGKTTVTGTKRATESSSSSTPSKSKSKSGASTGGTPRAADTTCGYSNDEKGGEGGHASAGGDDTEAEDVEYQQARGYDVDEAAAGAGSRGAKAARMADDQDEVVDDYAEADVEEEERRPKPTGKRRHADEDEDEDNPAAPTQASQLPGSRATRGRGSTTKRR